MHFSSSSTDYTFLNTRICIRVFFYTQKKNTAITKLRYLKVK